MPANPQAIRQGAACLWYWRAPSPPLVGQTPAVAFVAPGGGTLLSGSLSPMWSPTLGTVSAIAADRQTLTLTNVLPALSVTAAGAWGDAWIASEDGYVPAKVVRIDRGQASTSVLLAEPLPRDVDVSAATLLPAWYSRQLLAADVAATAQRGVTWRVSWAPFGAGPESTAVQSLQDVGVLDVVRTPFSTGLTTEDLVSLMDPGGSRVPARAQGYEAAIGASLDELVAYLRGDSPSGLDEHDLNGPELRPVHRHLACAYLARSPDESVRYRALAFALWDRIRLRCWRDANRDGLATDSERAHPLTWVGGTYSTSTAARRSWDDVD